VICVFKMRLAAILDFLKGWPSYGALCVSNGGRSPSEVFTEVKFEGISGFQDVGFSL